MRLKKDPNEIIKPDKPIAVDVEGGRHYHVVGDPGTFFGTPEAIVFDMRFWDTGIGRVKTNKGYMKLVANRIDEGFPVCNNETAFLRTLYTWGFIEIKNAN